MTREQAEGVVEAIIDLLLSREVNGSSGFEAAKEQLIDRLCGERKVTLEQAIREHDARDCRNMNAYGLTDMDGGPFNYGRGR
jgi:hypothetical protein